MNKHNKRLCLSESRTTKYDRPGGFNTDIYLLAALDAEVPDQGLAGSGPGESSPAGLQKAAFPVFSHGLPWCACMERECVPSPVSLNKNINPIGSGTHPCDSISPKLLPWRPHLRIQPCWEGGGLGFQNLNVGGPKHSVHDNLPDDSRSSVGARGRSAGDGGQRRAEAGGGHAGHVKSLDVI